MQRAIFLADEAATLQLGARLARQLEPGMRVYLSGDLGSGKTTLTRGVLRELGFSGRVKSPTYTLVELYSFSRLDLYHFDFYRFQESNEWQDAGFREAFSAHAAIIAEWPERAQPWIPLPDVAITLSAEADGRRAQIEASSALGEKVLAALAD